MRSARSPGARTGMATSTAIPTVQLARVLTAEGALQHLALALHAAPQLPQLALDEPQQRPRRPPSPDSCPVRFANLLPEWSQGPPVDC